MQPELRRGSCRDVWRFEWFRLVGMEREDVLLTRGGDGWYNPALQSQSQQQTAFSYRSSLRVDVKIFLFLAAANLISHLQLGKTQPVLAETQKAPFCCCSPTPTKWWFWKAHISENDVSLTPDSWFFCNCPPPPPVKYTWTEGRKEQSERSTVTCARNPVSYSQGKKSKHNSMPTKRELYQRSNLFHTMGKPRADRKELCFPLHASIWLLLVMQQGKKKIIISKGSQDGWSHTSPLRTQTCSPWLETLQGSANWHLSKHSAARAAWEPFRGALISRAACVVIPPRESPASKQMEKFPPVHGDRLPGWIKGSHGCGFSLLTPEVSWLLPS